MILNESESFLKILSKSKNKKKYGKYNERREDKK